MNRCFALSLLLNSLIIGCGPVSTDGTDGATVPSGDCELDEDCALAYICDVDVCVAGDRDNAFADATPLLLNEDQAGFIFPEEDVDLFAYESPAGDEWLLISTTSDEDDTGGLDTVVTVYAANGAVHHVMDDLGIWGITTYDSRMLVYLPTAGTWYIEVTDQDGDGDEDWDYTLSVTETNSVTSEPDSIDAPSVDRELISGTTIYQYGINIDEAGDSDFIDLTMPWADAALMITGPSSIPGSDAEPTVRLTDPNGDEVLYLENVGIDSQHAMYVRPEAITYTLEATDARGNGGPNHWFVLYIRTYSEGGSNDIFSEGYELEREPNDTFDDAWSPLQDGLIADDGTPYLVARFDGLLDEENDEDWITIAADSDEYLSTRCWTTDLGSLGALSIEFTEADGTTIAGVSYEDADPLETYNIPVPYDGNFGVRVFSPDAGPYGPGTWYRCLVWNTTWEIPT